MNSTFKTILLLCLLFIKNSIYSQSWTDFPQKHLYNGVEVKLNHDNSFLLQFKPSTSKKELLTLFQSLNVPFEIELIDTSWHILTLRTQNDSHYGMYGMVKYSAKQQILSSLNASNLFTHVQFSHSISKRKMPNDPNLFKQYQPDLLKLYNVWENTVGGIDKNGDTVVVAIIDDGIDTSHVDLKNNLFRNWNEIPYNGIDDDGNGYVDDYQGWNGVENNPVVFTPASLVDGHGTLVSGVLGAEGNNGIGVCGVNWKTKILPLVYYPSTVQGDAEQGIIHSMIYACKMKKLYQTSNKTKGANIIVVNMSLGADDAFPEDYPIWCSLYDSLGAVGIVAVASATNRDVKVGMKGEAGTRGDIPTLCGSKYLITVNSSDITDQHSSSGFSNSYVDIAAPGENAYSTFPTVKQPTNPYKTESGTSFASPLVAGAFSLIQTSSCKVFLKLAETNFDSAMSLYRLWMLNGAYKSGAFSNLNVAGGRLDVLGMWQQMDSWCWKHDNLYTSVKKLDAQNSVFRIFPNPSSGNFTISFKNLGGDVKISLLNLLGQCVYFDEFNGDFAQNVGKQGDFTKVLKINQTFSAGTYWVKCEANGRVYIEKIIIQ